jgi:integrase
MVLATAEAAQPPRYIASLWIENRYNPKQIKRLMGHSSIKVTFEVYGHLFADPEADQRAVWNFRKSATIEKTPVPLPGKTI